MTILTNAFSKKSSSTSAPATTASDSGPMATVEGGQQLQQLGSPVTQMFSGRSVFITGASGFIGRVLLEKLLRCYPNIKTIYILMRQKRNQNPHDRLHKQLLNVPIFDQIRSMKNGQELLAKIVVIPGDIADSWLGISDANLQLLFQDPSLSIVFHSAATIKFDEPLKVSVRLNLIATRTVIEFCRRLPNLISFCHVSTCYTNSDILDQTTMIEEKIYPMNDDPKDLMQLADILEEDLMQSLKRSLVKSRPNTYTYTKALAEKFINAEASDLPVAIVRPSIVVASWKDPIPGWVDNINGPTGLLLAIGKGLLRSLYCNTAAKADIIPVDIVVNSMIASAYYAARAHNKFHPIAPGPSSMMVAPPNGIRTDQTELVAPANAGKTISCNNNINEKTTEDKCENSGATQTKRMESSREEEISAALSLPKPPIFQINSGDLNPITWADMEQLCMPIIRRYPSCQVLRYPYGTFKTSQLHDVITRIFVHYLPALFLDTICLLMGKKRQLLSIYYKLHCAVAALAHFMTFSYNFRTANLTKLRAILDEEDSKTLFMDIENLNWLEFWHGYVLGCRRYILRESDDSLEQARKSFQKSRLIELTFRAGLVALALACLAMLFYGQGFIQTPESSECSSDKSASGSSIIIGDLEPALAALNGTCHNQSSASQMVSSFGTYCGVTTSDG